MSVVGQVLGTQLQLIPITLRLVKTNEGGHLLVVLLNLDGRGLLLLPWREPRFYLGIFPERR